MREADALTLPVFFKHPVGLTVGEIATLTGAKLRTGPASMTSSPTSRRSTGRAHPISRFSTPPNTPTS